MALHLALVAVGGMVAGYGLWRVRSAGVTEYTSSSPASTDGEIASQGAPPELVVEVAGAVEKPGVYRLPLGSRVAQALTQAGNPTIDVDKEFITQELNLAQELQDQQKIYLPFALEKEKLADGKDFSESNSVENDGLISLNDASASQLMELEGIGEKRADDIIAGRPYAAIEDLLNQKIVTSTQWAKIKNRVKL